MKKNLRKYCIVSGVSIVIIAIIALIFVVLTISKNPQKPHTDTETGSSESGISLYDAFIESATNSTAKDNSLYNEALQNQRIDLCENISDESKKTECRDTIRIAAITVDGDQSACESIQDTSRNALCRDTVAEKYAIDRGKKQLCARITNETRKQRCREDIDAAKLRDILSSGSATEEICNALEEGFRQSCLRSVDTTASEISYLEAIRTKNAAMCSKIVEENLQNNCRDTIYLDLAQSQSRGELCLQISDTEKKTFCLSRTKTTTELNNFKKATESNDLSLCETISTDSLRNSCHDSVILALVRSSRNFTLCNTLTQPNLIDSCKRIENP